MLVELPKFVTSLLLQETFRRNLSNDGLTVTSFWGEWATKTGENYASEMYRIHVEYVINDASYKSPVLLKVNDKDKANLFVIFKDIFYNSS